MKLSLARLSVAAGTTGAVLLLTAAPSWAHIGTSEDEVAAGATLALGLTVGHGCEDSPTTAVAIQIPEGINNASAFAHPGWTIAAEPETLSPPVTSAHGEEVTERVSVITFTANPGNALPHDVRDTFTINFAAPETPGETLWFKT
ncbi:MAG: YcnI family protein, partial [Acidimicrobiales bacterium]